mmetsp:Transcript_72674/g.161496  ORF Transcript_72674/g.161496 Transcript_72674/m.161496 type:complete len:209 (-) Transcript_72674:7-633(-)
MPEEAMVEYMRRSCAGHSGRSVNLSSRVVCFAMELRERRTDINSSSGKSRRPYSPVRTASSGVSGSSWDSFHAERTDGGWPTKSGLLPGAADDSQKRSTSKDETSRSSRDATVCTDGTLATSASKPRCEISRGDRHEGDSRRLLVEMNSNAAAAANVSRSMRSRRGTSGRDDLDASLRGEAIESSTSSSATSRGSLAEPSWSLSPSSS